MAGHEGATGDIEDTSITLLFDVQKSWIMLQILVPYIF
jgi:hypothetical protein